MSYNNKKKAPLPEPKYPLGFLLPLIAVLAIIPVIIYEYQFDTGLTQYDYYQGVSLTSDFFLHCKMVLLLFTLAVMIFILAYMIFSAEITPLWDRTLIPFFVYCGLCLISAFTSINPSYSFSGIHEQFESVWILLGYGLILYYAFFNLNTAEAVKRTMRWFVGGITIMSLFGLGQAIYLDPETMPWLKTLGITKAMSFNPMAMKFFQNLFLQDKDAVISFNFENGRTYMSLYNPNYVGFYVALAVPVLAALLIHKTQNNTSLPKHKKVLSIVGYSFLIVSMLIILLASQSRAGLVALAAAAVIMLVFMRKIFLKSFQKHWMVTGGAIVAVIGIFIGVNIMNQGVLIDRIKSIFDTSEETHPLESILTDEDVTITYNGETMHITTELDAEGNTIFHLTDDEQQELSTIAPENPTETVTGDSAASLYTTYTQPYTINDPRFPFSYATIVDDSFKGFCVFIDGRQWVFTNQMKEMDTSYYCKGYGSALTKLEEPEKGPAFLEEHYHLANMRGYIWARTIPLLKKYFFLGSGPDTFVIAYQNDDWVGLYNSGHDKEVVTRPHCMYLQIATQTGVPSLIAFLTYFIWYIASSVRLYWKADYTRYLPKIGLAALVSVIAYLILGLTNDSCITVSPIFFALAGMGLGINYHLKQEAREAALAEEKRLAAEARKKEKAALKARNSSPLR